MFWMGRLKPGHMGPELGFIQPAGHHVSQDGATIGIGMEISAMEHMPLGSFSGDDQNKPFSLSPGVSYEAQKGRFGGVPGSSVQIKARIGR
jgi:hypothetical protein|tara:strand:- start:5312 stop:5584 length:273 start_codon:yes stop_codon:yes gene_type:complete